MVLLLFSGLHTMIAKSVVELKLFSGVVVHITPVSQFMLSKLREKARELYPDVDTSKYEVEQEDGISGLKFLDENNPEYQAERLMLELQRSQYINDTCYRWCLDFPDGQEALIEHFRPQLELFAEEIDIEDEWGAVLQYCILVSQEDVKNINAIIGQRTPITQEEVNDSLAIFRPVLSKNGHSTLAKAGASRAEGE